MERYEHDWVDDRDEHGEADDEADAWEEDEEWAEDLDWALADEAEDMGVDQ